MVSTRGAVHIGGSDFMKALKANCYDKDNNVFTFKSDVDYYKMCEKQYVCEP